MILDNDSLLVINVSDKHDLSHLPKPDLWVEVDVQSDSCTTAGRSGGGGGGGGVCVCTLMRLLCPQKT